MIVLSAILTDMAIWQTEARFTRFDFSVCLLSHFDTVGLYHPQFSEICECSKDCMVHWELSAPKMELDVLAEISTWCTRKTDMDTCKQHGDLWG